MRSNRYGYTLVACPPTGTGSRAVHRWILTTANHAVRAGLSEWEWSADVRAHAPREIPDGELREAWEKAAGTAGPWTGGKSSRAASPKPATPKATKTRAAFVALGRMRIAAADEFFRSSPVPLEWDAGLSGPSKGEPWRDTLAFLRAAFLPGEFVALGEWTQTCGKPWIRYDVRERDAWCAHFQRFPDFIPTLVVPNPVRPSAGGEAKITDEDVAVFRHVVCEADDDELDEQLLFFAGVGLEHFTAITFSASKSYHGLLRVDVPDRETWRRKVQGELFPKALAPLGLDEQCKNPARASRLAGAWRIPAKEKKYFGKPNPPPEARQRLEWVQPPMEERDR